MNGIEFVKKVKAIRPETKVILMTAIETDLPELSKTLPSVKIDGLMLKPGSLESLVDTIKKLYEQLPSYLKENPKIIWHLICFIDRYYCAIVLESSYCKYITM